MTTIFSENPPFPVSSRHYAKLRKIVTRLKRKEEMSASIRHRLRAVNVPYLKKKKNLLMIERNPLLGEFRDDQSLPVSPLSIYPEHIRIKS